MPASGLQSSKNTYTCTCTHFCGGYKTGLSRATFYRHSPYRDAAQPSSFSSSFQNFLDNSAGNCGSGLGQEESQGNTDNLEAGFSTQSTTTPPHVLDASTWNFEEAAGVNFLSNLSM
jgi:hypothetical protein